MPWGTGSSLGLAFLLGGCVAETGTTPTLVPDHPYESESQVLALDLGQLERDLQLALDVYDQFDPAWVTDAYDHAMSLRTPSCPNVVETQTEYGVDMTYWGDGCNISNGEDEVTFFNGPMTTWDWQEIAVDLETQALLRLYEIPWQTDEIPVWTGRGLNGQTDIYGSSVDFNCSCLSHYAEGRTDKNDLWMRVVDGPSHSTWDASADAWINANVQVSQILFARKAHRDGRQFAAGEIQITGIGEVYRTLSMVYSLRDSQDGGCSRHHPDEYPLSMQVREATTGQWTALDWTLDEDTCEACTTVDELTACVSLGHFVDWEDAPW